MSLETHRNVDVAELPPQTAGAALTRSVSPALSLALEGETCGPKATQSYATNGPVVDVGEVQATRTIADTAATKAGSLMARILRGGTGALRRAPHIGLVIHAHRSG